MFRVIWTKRLSGTRKLGNPNQSGSNFITFATGKARLRWFLVSNYVSPVLIENKIICRELMWSYWWVTTILLDQLASMQWTWSQYLTLNKSRLPFPATNKTGTPHEIFLICYSMRVGGHEQFMPTRRHPLCAWFKINWNLEKRRSSMSYSSKVHKLTTLGCC